jgi:hypothetical protein
MSVLSCLNDLEHHVSSKIFLLTATADISAQQAGNFAASDGLIASVSAAVRVARTTIGNRQFTLIVFDASGYTVMD